MTKSEWKNVCNENITSVFDYMKDRLFNEEYNGQDSYFKFEKDGCFLSIAE